MKQFFVRLWEALKEFWANLSEKRMIPVSVKSEVHDNRLIDHFEEGDPFSNTTFVMLDKPVVFEKDVVRSTYQIVKIRKSDRNGIRFDLKNISTGHIARRVHISKLRGITDIEYVQIKKERG